MPGLDEALASERLRLQEIERRKTERLHGDIREVVKTAAGRRFYWRILEDAKIFHSDFNKDSREHARLTGRKEIGLERLNDLMAAKPDAFTQMQREYASEKKQEAERERARLADKET